jgi:hypothetical protein
MPVLLTPGTIAIVRQQRQATFTHTYTWIQRIDTTQDSEGGTVPEWAAPVSGRPCHLLPLELGRVDPSGAPLDVQAPRLIVPWDDPLTDGDAVRNVQDADGTVRLTGPAAVQQVTPQLAADTPTHKIALLSFETPQRSGAVPP